jgi:uncharacterized protein YodC (DUF2158 family)
MSDTPELELNMLWFQKRASIAITVMLGAALSMPLSVVAFSDPAPSNIAMQRQAAFSLQPGDLVRLRSGGPLMTIESVKGNQVDCFWDGLDGQPNAESFPIDVLQKY